MPVLSEQVTIKVEPAMAEISLQVDKTQASLRDTIQFTGNLSENSSPIFGAEVSIVLEGANVVVATGLTDSFGNFSISVLMSELFQNYGLDPMVFHAETPVEESSAQTVSGSGFGTSIISTNSLTHPSDNNIKNKYTLQDTPDLIPPRGDPTPSDLIVDILSGGTLVHRWSNPVAGAVYEDTVNRSGENWYATAYPSSDVWSVSGDLIVNGVFDMIVSKASPSVTVDILVPVISIGTDKATYKDIETIHVSGILSEDGMAIPDETVNLLINDVFWASVLTGSDGSYAFDILAGDLGIGTHTIVTSSMDVSGSVTAEVVGVEEVPPEPPPPITKEETMVLALAIGFPLSIIVLIRVLGEWPPAWVQDIQRRMRVRIK